MKKRILKFNNMLGIVFVLTAVLSAQLFASSNRPKPRPRPYSASEPAAIGLIGIGLVSLGIYAKKKRGKKQ